MANQSEDPALSSAQIVGNAFIQQYYLALHKSPDVVHKFYSDNSVLSRPGPDGVMTSATTMQEINEMLLSLDYQNYHAQILTVDAQFSYKDGVIVLVTGSLTGNNNERRKFTQSFFLAPQGKVAKSYFVLNDVFRYVDDAAGNDVDESLQTPLTPPVELTNAADEPMPSEIEAVEVEIEAEVDNGNDESQVIAPLDPEKELITEKGVVVVENGHAEVNGLAEKPVDPGQIVAPSVIETAPSALPEDAPKKSFASVVNELNKNSAPFHMRAPQPKPARLVEKPRAPVVPEQPVPTANSALEKNNDPAFRAYAIFVANLPMNATVEELDKLFKQFGPIKPDGIQVRSNKGTCFGFVEFESASSMQSALEASPIVFGNRKLSIEERRANNDRAKFSGRSGYRNDNFRGNRGNYGGNRGYGRNEFERRGELSGRARGNGNAGRNGQAYQRPIPNGGERAAHQEAKVA